MQNAAQGQVIFRSGRRRAGRACPQADASLMRIEAAARASLDAHDLLADRVEQLEFALTHFVTAEDGVLDRLSRLEARLEAVSAMARGPEGALAPRLDRLTEMLASLSARVVQASQISARPVSPPSPPMLADQAVSPSRGANPAPLQPLSPGAQSRGRAAPMPADAAAMADADAADLGSLPGIGPGLVRMLEKAGLTRVDQLACADAVRLRDALGPVGDVLDTGFLVDRAREHVMERAAVPVEAASLMRAAG